MTRFSQPSSYFLKPNAPFQSAQPPSDIASARPDPPVFPDMENNTTASDGGREEGDTDSLLDADGETDDGSAVPVQTVVPSTSSSSTTQHSNV